MLRSHVVQTKQLNLAPLLQLLHSAESLETSGPVHGLCDFRKSETVCSSATFGANPGWLAWYVFTIWFQMT